MSFSAEERERTALRFDVGDRVECDIGQWVAGTVHKCWCECPTARKCAIASLCSDCEAHGECSADEEFSLGNPEWEEGMWAAYQVRMDDGTMIWAPNDNNTCVRELSRDHDPLVEGSSVKKPGRPPAGTVAKLIAEAKAREEEAKLIASARAMRPGESCPGCPADLAQNAAAELANKGSYEQSVPLWEAAEKGFRAAKDVSNACECRIHLCAVLAQSGKPELALSRLQKAISKTTPQLGKGSPKRQAVILELLNHAQYRLALIHSDLGSSPETGGTAGGTCAGEPAHPFRLSPVSKACTDRVNFSAENGVRCGQSISRQPSSCWRRPSPRGRPASARSTHTPSARSASSPTSSPVRERYVLDLVAGKRSL